MPKLKINRLREKGLRVSLNDEASKFNDRLFKSNDTTIRVKRYSKTYDWILQISLLSFGFHNESFYKKNPHV